MFQRRRLRKLRQCVISPHSLPIVFAHPLGSHVQSYTSAQADAVPPYWENTIHVPAAQDSDTMIIEDWPVGTFAIFAINCFVSFLFQVSQIRSPSLLAPLVIRF